MRDPNSDMDVAVIRAESISPVHEPPAGAFPLSIPQLGLWTAEQMNLGGSANISAQYSEIGGGIDVALFEQASRQVLQESEALRLRFDDVAGQPLQWVVPLGGWSLPLIDLSGAPEPYLAAFSWMQHQRAKPIDPRSGRAFRWSLLRLAPGRFVWSFEVHHLIMDGFGRNLIWRRLEQVYAALASHERVPPVEFEPLRQRFAEEQTYYRSASFDADRCFFSRLLERRPAYMSLSRKAAATTRAFRRETTRPVESTTVGLRAAVAGASLARAFVAAAALLQRSELGGDDIVIGMVVSARVTPADRRTPSMLTNIVPLRLRLDDAMTVDELLTKAAGAIRAVMPHQRYPAQALRRDLHLLPMAADIYSVTVNFMPFDPGRSFAGHPASTHNLSHGPIGDLVVGVFDAPGSAELRVDLNGNAELYETAELARLAHRLNAILSQLAAEAGKRSIATLLEELSAPTATMPTPAERALLEAWGRNERPYPKGRTVVDLFTEVALVQPRAVALIAGSRRWTYQELNERANAVAHALHRCGVARAEHVPLLLPRGAQLIICALGVLKLGAIYVPIDPGLPAERRTRLLKLLHARAGVGDAVPAATSPQWLPVSVADRRETLAPPTPHAASAEDAAYVMFTSGSTGQPKGVVVPHRGIVRLARGQDFVDMGTGESWLHLASTSFDASTLEIWAPLLNGGRCIVIEADVPTPALLSAVIAREGARSAFLTTSLFNVLVDESPECLAGLRQILVGGETLSPAHVRRALERLPGIRLMNAYGPTENTTFTCCHPITPADVAPGHSVPIGRPIANSTVQVLDGEGNLAPIGVAGELVTGGDGVALGYLGLPQQTELSFVPDPTSTTREARRYRTGDLVRWRSDGLLEFLGRLDEQLKINGYRIEPSEIAAVLAEYPGVRRAAVVPRETRIGETGLVAYVVPEAAHQGDAFSLRLAQHLAERLPPYMMVASFVLLDALPLKPNGKLDVAALPQTIAEPAPATPSPGATTGSDDVVIALIAELLSQPVARHDNLYALGADSLALIRLVARLKSRIAIELSIGEVMKRGDVADILQMVAQQHRLVAAAAAAGPCSELCSPWQTWYWRLQQLDPSDDTAVVFRAYRIVGAIDADVLEQAVRALLGRHQALRCRLVGAADAEPSLELRPESEWILQRAAPLDAERLNDARHSERGLPFDLRRELPLRVTLQPDADRPGESELWVSTHHSAYDGASEEIFWRELPLIYHNVETGAPALAELPPLAASYFELARRQRAAFDAATLQARERYWGAKLSGAPEQLGITAAAAETVGARQTRHIRRSLPGGLTESIRQRGRQGHISVAMLCLAAFEALLWRWGGDRDQLIALDFAGRSESLEQDQIGLFTSPLALRADLSGNPSLLELARANRAQFGEALSQRIPFERLVSALGDWRRRLRGFRIFFGYFARSAPPSLGAAPLAEVHPDLTSKHTDLRLNVEDREGELSIELAGATALFDESDLARLADSWQHCLTQLGQRPDIRLSELHWISDADQAQLSRWNSTAADYPRDQPLHRLLRAQAMRSPTAVALEAGDLRLTYVELFQRADKLAARLRHAGVAGGSRVGLYLDRHATLPQAMLAILETGAAYVPLDPGFPRHRLAFMIEDADLRAIVTRRPLVAELPPHTTQVICIDDEETPLPPDAPGTAADAGSVAYVLFTSGSTGKPKGVEVEHRQLVNFLCGMARSLGIGAGDALLAVTSISFDIAGLEIWLPLLCGARLCLAGREEIVDADLLRRALVRSRATALQATPVTWRALLASGWSGGARFKALVGGEALPADLAQLLAASCGQAFNLYGPTETTIWSSAWRLPRTVSKVCVGRPISNTELHVLDEERRLLPIGVAGELFIAGEGVARGYLNRPELTAERFVNDPFRGGSARMYRTGDLARWLPDGTVELLGRNDDQIKIRGHRIETGEVEAALLQLRDVGQAAVALHRAGNGEPRLIAGLVPVAGTSLPSSALLRAQLRQWLPEYMLPYHFVTLTALPLTPNGKVDRRSLACLNPVSEQEGSSARAPAATTSVLEASLLEHFGRSVGLTITLDSDFFESGGDSLEALRLVARLSQAMGMEVTSGELFLHSTPRRMAARLELLRTGAAHPRHLLPLRAGESHAAVLFVHPMGGHLTPYGRLIHHLGESVTLFGLQAGTGQQYESLAQRCSAYVGEIMAASSGPLMLVGYSLGGALAIEMAQQLRQAGRVVPLVVMLDAPVPRRGLRGWPKFKLRLQELWRFSWNDRFTWLKDQFQRRVGGLPSFDFGEDEGLVDTADMRLLITQALQWQPPGYDGKVHLFRASRNLRGYPNPIGALGWDRYCSDLDIVSLPCDHADILVEPQVQRVVEDIQSLLDATLRR